ncbi:MAG: response regulator, partial [Planctomycetota bacterium]
DIFDNERKRKVLLVGTAVNREGQKAFQAKGWEVMHVADAEEARATAWRLRPDAIVADALLTGQDGFQLSLAIHADKAMARVPIILVSDIFDTEDDRDVARRVGACGLLPRSGEPGELVALVERSMDRAPPSPVGDKEELRADIADRIRAALRRRLRVGGESSHRLAFLEASVRLLGMLAEALAAPTGDRKSPVELLSHCLAASGTSRGMAYLTAPGGALMMAAEVGISGVREQGARIFFGHPEVLEVVATEQRPLVVPSKEVSHEAAQDILGGLDATSVLVAPLRLGEDSFGAIVLASNRYDLADWTGLASAVSVPISQALALARSRGGSGD